uniref:C-type lectin domain-containing protein n=1 Tax=Anas platyrhynchos TaxID=8839 RepID=A0A8B9SUJ9_ANAPL
MGTGERGRGGCHRRISGCVCVCGSPCPVCPRLANVSLTSCASPSTIFFFFPSPAPALPSPATSTLPCLPHPFPPGGDTSLPSHPMPRVPSHPKPSPDWQATRELRDTSLEQAAERGRFSQEARAWEQSLEQARRELAQARAELQRAWREGNSSLLELGRQEAELARVSIALAGAERELQDVQGRLNTSESTVSLLRSCTAVDCCPSGWLLYRGKCLFVSSEKKTWDDSRAECERKYSQLLITKSWSRWTVPTFLKNADTVYWIGLQKTSFPWYDYGWLEEGEPDSDGITDAWFWVDGSLYDRPWQSKLNGSCAVISRGNIKPAPCEAEDDLHLWICEKAAGPSGPFM